jgi:hypothetical protein
MHLQLFRYGCPECGDSFELPEVPDGSYGVFLMRSEGGHTISLNAVETPEYLEVGDLLKAHPKLTVLDDFRIADLLQKLFGIACDLAPDGTQYQINRDPICPVCGSKAGKSWESVEPPQYVRDELSRATHRLWNGLSAQGKQLVVDSAVVAAGY